MTPEQFTFWLAGYIDRTDRSSLSAKEVDRVREVITDVIKGDKESPMDVAIKGLKGLKGLDGGIVNLC